MGLFYFVQASVVSKAAMKHFESSGAQRLCPLPQCDYAFILTNLSEVIMMQRGEKGTFNLSGGHVAILQVTSWLTLLNPCFRVCI